MKYSEIIENLSNSIIQRFDEVWHSAEIVTNDEGKKFPGVPLEDNNWEDLAPSDIQEAIYIRRNGDDEATEDKIGSCTKAYKMRSQLRVVFFKDHAEKHNEILQKLMQSVLISGTKLNKVIRDKYKLLKEESSGEYSFGPKAAYFAIDIYALWELTPDTCEEDFCLTNENPLKKCLVVV